MSHLSARTDRHTTSPAARHGADRAPSGTDRHPAGRAPAGASLHPAGTVRPASPLPAGAVVAPVVAPPVPAPPVLALVPTGPLPPAVVRPITPDDVAGEDGSLVAEYGLLAVVAATVAGVLISWASSGALASFFGQLLEHARSLVVS